MCILGGAKVINVSVSPSCRCVLGPLAAAPQLSRGGPYREADSRLLSMKSLTENSGSALICKRIALERVLLFLESFLLLPILMPIQSPENETVISLHYSI